MPTETTQHEATPENTPWPPWANTYIESLRRIPDESAAARAANVERSTAWRLKKRNQSFDAACTDAREHALDTLERAIYMRGTVGQSVTRTVTKKDGDGNLLEVTTTEDRIVSNTLAMFYLKRWRPEYRESYRVEQTGKDGGPIEVRTLDVLDEEIARLTAELDHTG